MYSEGGFGLSEVVRYLRPIDNPLLKREQREFPAVREFILRPYVNRHWGLRLACATPAAAFLKTSDSTFQKRRSCRQSTVFLSKPELKLSKLRTRPAFHFGLSTF